MCKLKVLKNILKGKKKYIQYVTTLISDLNESLKPRFKNFCTYCFLTFWERVAQHQPGKPDPLPFCTKERGLCMDYTYLCSIDTIGQAKLGCHKTAFIKDNKKAIKDIVKDMWKLCNK